MTTATGYSRRRFLRDLGVAGGAGVVLGSMEVLGLAPPVGAKVAFRPPRASDFHLGGRRNGASVLILGAGVAGLAAAYELEKAGYRCTILEARGRTGGRNWTVRDGTTETDLRGMTQTASFDDGLYMNAGPARIPQHHTTLDYCRELGVPIEVFTNQNADAYSYSESAGPLSGQKVRHRTAKADYYGYVSELLAKATDQGALDQQLGAADKEALIQFLRSFGSLAATGPDAGRYVGSGRRGYVDQPGGGFQAGTTAPPYALSDLLASRLGLNFAFEFGWDQAMLMFEPVGGMDRIPAAFERVIRGRIIFGAEITRITNEGAGVSVDYVGPGGSGVRRATADYCVCTIPPQILKRIESNFSEQVKADLAVPVPVSTGKIGLEYRRRFWEEDEDIYGGITNTAMAEHNLGTIWYPSSGYLGRKGVVIGYYNFGATADAFGALPHSERERIALQQGAKIHGRPYVDELESSFSVDWLRTKYSEGGWVSWPSGTRGDAATPYGRLLQPDGRVWFAGDHLSHVIAWQHGAFESARLAVMDLHTRALAS